MGVWSLAVVNVIGRLEAVVTNEAFSQSGTTYAEVLCKNSYVGRTFIQPSTKKRKLGVSMKFGVLEHNVRGKRIVLVDDSIVRGNTMAPIIRLLKGRGALEVG